MTDGDGRKAEADSRETAVPRVRGHSLGSLPLWPLPGQKQ